MHPLQTNTIRVDLKNKYPSQAGTIDHLSLPAVPYLNENRGGSIQSLHTGTNKMRVYYNNPPQADSTHNFSHPAVF